MNHLPTLLAAVALAADPGTTPDVSVEIHPHGDAAPEVRGTVILDAPLGEVLAVLRDVGRYAEFMPKVSRSELLAGGGDEAIGYVRYALPWPMSDRDSVGRYTVERRGDAVLFRAEAMDHPRWPRGAGVVRLDSLRLSWTLEPVPGDGKPRTRVVYTTFVDLGGNLPRFARDRVANEEAPLVFAALRERLARR